ncbi:hypothetical protein OHV05_37445 (plasmid) [Kitasatospora sp. NBC_00070]|uniref:hypothetical protein n=1 Tax=Kitasatospora sp. NBC_00070 TaxID=2975962 RepID=UPI002F90C999
MDPSDLKKIATFARDVITETNDALLFSALTAAKGLSGWREDGDVPFGNVLEQLANGQCGSYVANLGELAKERVEGEEYSDSVRNKALQILNRVLRYPYPYPGHHPGEWLTHDALVGGLFQTNTAGGPPDLDSTWYAVPTNATTVVTATGATNAGPAPMNAASVVPDTPVISNVPANPYLWTRSVTRPVPQILYAFSLTQPEPTSTAWTTREAATNQAQAHHAWLKEGISYVKKQINADPGSYDIPTEDLTNAKLIQALETEAGLRPHQ